MDMRSTKGLMVFALAVAFAASPGCSREQAPTSDASAQGDAATGDEALRGQAGGLIGGEGQKPAERGADVDARPLAGQAETGIRALLGAPHACEDVANGRRCRYARGATDIVFIDGMADWITVADLGGAPFAPAALARVGLPTDVAPAESTPELMRWQNLGGFREVTLHAGPAGTASRIELRMMAL